MKAKPCDTCPWLRQNQTPEAVKASPVDGRGVHWFAQSNLRDRWRFVASGGMLPCHATDRNAPLYGGKWTTAKEGRICAGLTILAQREIRHFMECGMQREKYAATKGHRFTLKALAMWASMLHFTGHQIVAGSNCLTIPETEPDDRVALPWPDPVQHATD